MSAVALVTHVLENAVNYLFRLGVENRELDVLLLAEVDADQRIQSVEQLLQGVNLIGRRLSQPVDAFDDRLVVVNHWDRRIPKADEPCPLGVQHLLLGLGVWNEGASEEFEHRRERLVALLRRELRNISTQSADVLQVLEQLLVFVAKRLCR